MRVSRLLLMAATWFAATATLSSSAEAPRPRVAAGPIGDYGDAPEGSEAYPGVDGHFPTCSGYKAPPGTTEFVCVPRGTEPRETGYVVHLDHATFPLWIGCGPLNVAYDVEPEAKINLTPGPCGEGPVDCVIEAPTSETRFGQDECLDDGDAGLRFPKSFVACSTSVVAFDVTYDLPPGPDYVYFINVLVDWNMDGDWNDSFQCPGRGTSAGRRRPWRFRPPTRDPLPGRRPAFRSPPTRGRCRRVRPASARRQPWRSG